MVLLGFGAGMTFNPLLLTAMNDADRARRGLASGVVTIGATLLRETVVDAPAGGETEPAGELVGVQ